MRTVDRNRNSPARLAPVLSALLATLALAPTASAAQIAVLGATVQERAARAGDRYEGVIRLFNDSDAPQEVSIYQTDYQFTADGTSHYGDPGRLPRSNAPWIRLGARRITVAPRSQIDVAYTVEVPPERALAGSYWSMLMVEADAPPAPEPDPSRPQLALQARVRYGIQVVSHLPGGASDARFEKVRLLPAEGGAYALEYDLVNTGETAWRVRLAVELYDELGNLAQRFVSPRGLVYSGSSIRQRFALTELPEGSYRALLLADTGGEQIFGTQVRLTFTTH